MTTRTANRPLPPFANEQEERNFFMEGLLQLVEKTGGRNFTLLILPQGTKLSGGKGVGERELRKHGVRTLEEIRQYLLKDKNAGRHLGRKAARHLVKYGSIR